MERPKVIDFFCGGGGFSEGFRQQGFEIIMGIDNWSPAIETFNHNYNLSCVTKNILDFELSIADIEALPDSEVIIGSPPCVSFSSSNKSGKADKALGIRLIEIFLKIVVVKKYSHESKLKAWFMENVTKSAQYIPYNYTFESLGLVEWAKTRDLDPKSVAIKIIGNTITINSAEYGSPQSRKRLITGEIFALGKLPRPRKLFKLGETTDSGTLFENIKQIDSLPSCKTLKDIKAKLPKPNEYVKGDIVEDPLYSTIQIKQELLTDHFYDTGLYKVEWENSKFLKMNHPYMGVMSFPENENKPSRTITATKIGTSRESIIYKSEYDRIGNGEYRTATLREAATIMGFPITYQFKGLEGTKWRLVGNAVCPAVSRAFAKETREALGLEQIENQFSCEGPNIEGISNLNTYKKRSFETTPKKIKGSRFRRHPFKDGNITVTLSNYDIEKNEKFAGKWLTSVQYGNGKGFPTYNYPDGFYKNLEQVINRFEGGRRFVEVINNGFSEKIAPGNILQELHEQKDESNQFLGPAEIIEKIAILINEIEFENPIFKQEDLEIFKKKMSIPKKQVLALYAINKVSTLANI
ncbi:DNA cytosine methyltransferase [Fibrella forsythiae]|uniref:DNA (cytosine-5-)-methyltransferase n=1 Tax=Fibrella forsythiae TaxID=2817061 RepID=A0ABS3JVB7_9BACT|nr:DNA cytosine methyltransferase [Fibrella forsythiae]MBO0953114.1 DNA cytosine methyltransferase [Fibrella forsythiae]